MEENKAAHRGTSTPPRARRPSRAEPRHAPTNSQSKLSKRTHPASSLQALSPAPHCHLARAPVPPLQAQSFLGQDDLRKERLSRHHRNFKCCDCCAAHATPAAPRTNTWNEFSEGPGHGVNGQGPRGFASRLLDTLNTYGGTGATANAVASPSNYGGKKKGQLNALRGVDSPRNDSKFQVRDCKPHWNPKKRKTNQNIKTPCPNSVKTAHQQAPVVPATTAPTPCPYSGKNVQPALKKANPNEARTSNENPYSYSKTPATTAPTANGNAGGNQASQSRTGSSNGKNGKAGGNKGNTYANTGGNKNNYEPVGQSVTNAGANWGNVYNAPVSVAKSPAQTQAKKKAY